MGHSVRTELASNGPLDNFSIHYTMRSAYCNRENTYETGCYCFCVLWCWFYKHTVELSLMYEFLGACVVGCFCGWHVRIWNLLTCNMVRKRIRTSTRRIRGRKDINYSAHVSKIHIYIRSLIRYYIQLKIHTLLISIASNSTKRSNL